MPQEKVKKKSIGLFALTNCEQRECEQREKVKKSQEVCSQLVTANKSLTKFDQGSPLFAVTNCEQTFLTFSLCSQLVRTN